MSTGTVSPQAKAAHDFLLVMQPEGAAHPKDTCPMCATADPQEATVSDKTHSDAEVKAAVDAAVARATKPLEDDLAKARADQDVAAVAQAIEDATSPLAAKIVELEGKLDTALAEAKAANDDRDAIVAYLTAAADEEATAAARADVEAARLAQALEIGVIPEDRAKESASRWADMTADDWAEKVTEWEAIKAAHGPGTNGSEPPAQRTAMTAGDAGTGQGASTFKGLADLRKLQDEGVDASKVF